MANNIIRLSISEEYEVVTKICNALNALANPAERNGFKFSITDDKLIISVYRCRNSYASFEVSFTVDTIPDDMFFSCVNNMFRKCILFFDYTNPELIISLKSSYTAAKANKNIMLEEEFVGEKSSCILPLRKPFPELGMIIDIFNSVKIKKVLTLRPKVLNISATGTNTSISVKMQIVVVATSDVAFFCSKFNFLSAQGAATFRFNVMALNSESPELLEITIIPPSDNKEKKSKYDKTMDFINSIAPFNRSI